MLAYAGLVENSFPSVNSLRERSSELMELGRWTEVVDLLKGTPESTSDFEIAWNAGWAHFKLDDIGAAREILSRAVSLSPDNHAGHLALGLTLYGAGELKIAERHLRTALELRDTTTARLALALTYMQLGRNNDAENIHLEGISKQPNAPDRWAAYADFLSDCGRREDAADAYAKAKALMP